MEVLADRRPSHSGDAMSHEDDRGELLVIEPGSTGAPLLAEMWRYRGLLYFLAWRDMRVRYKQTVIGVAWAVLQPLAMMLVFTVILGRFAQQMGSGVAYPVFAFSGLILWNLMSGGITASAGSLVANTHLVTKVYFPRIIIPISALGAGIVDFAICFLLLGALSIVYGIAPSLKLVLVIPVLMIAILMTVSVGMLIAALTIRYRDLRHALPFVTQIWMFGSPIVYPLEMVPERWRAAYSLNPVVGIVAGFRASIFDLPFPTREVLTSAAVSICLLALAFQVFRRSEHAIADVI